MEEETWDENISRELFEDQKGAVVSAGNLFLKTGWEYGETEIFLETGLIDPLVIITLGYQNKTLWTKILSEKSKHSEDHDQSVDGEIF